MCLSEVAGPWPKPLRGGGRDDRQLGREGEHEGRERAKKKIQREPTAHGQRPLLHEKTLKT